MNTVTFFIYVGLGFFVLTCIAIIDAATREFGSLQKKAIWMLAAAIPFIGFIIYFIFGMRKGKRLKNPKPGQNND